MVSTISFATSFFDLRFKLKFLSSFLKNSHFIGIVPKPAPLSFNEFKTIISAFFFFNFSKHFPFHYLFPKQIPPIPAFHFSVLPGFLKYLLFFLIPEKCPCHSSLSFPYPFLPEYNQQQRLPLLQYLNFQILLCRHHTFLLQYSL